MSKRKNSAYLKIISCNFVTLTGFPPVGRQESMKIVKLNVLVQKPRFGKPDLLGETG